MIVWKGFGLVVPVVWAGAALTVNPLARLSSPPIAFALAGLLAGAAIVGLGVWTRRDPGTTVFDPAKGRDVVVKRKHSFMFIPLVYWGPISVVLGVVVPRLAAGK